MKYPVDCPDPLEPSRAWGNEKYNLNYMLLRQVKFPTYLVASDYHNGVYSDRVYEDWQRAVKLLEGYQGNLEDGSVFGRMTDLEFLEFCRVAINSPQSLTGARVIRCTNVSSGYPVWFIQGYRMDPEHPRPVYSSSKRAPNIKGWNSRCFDPRRDWLDDESIY